MISEKNTVKRIGNQLLFTGPTLLAFIAVIIVPFIYGIYMTFLNGMASHRACLTLGSITMKQFSTIQSFGLLYG